jgi:hypothetical protein
MEGKEKGRLKEDKRRGLKRRTIGGEVGQRSKLGSCHQLTILSLHISLISFPSSIFRLFPMLCLTPLHFSDKLNFSAQPNQQLAGGSLLIQKQNPASHLWKGTKISKSLKIK